jgi:Dolichyl-phosphate-mannose-protein mannosyltransferase
MSSPSTIERGSPARPLAPTSTASARVRGLLERHSLAAVLAIAVVMCFAGVFQRGLWTPDEPREAEIGREMMLSGLSPMPMLDGEPFLEKPPLYPWMMAVSYDLFGVSPGAARVPAALCSIGSMIVAYWLGRRAGGRRAGVLAAAVLATCAKFVEVSHCAINDAALVLFVSAGHLAFLIARDRERERRKTLAFVAIGACTALAFLTKALIGPILLIGPPIVAAALMREWRFLRHALPRASAWCVVFLVALGLPWVLALAHTGGWSAVRVCLVDNTIGRSLPGVKQEFGHEGRWYYYFTTVPVDMLPWTLVLPAFATSRALRANGRGGRARFLGLAFAAGFVLLSIPASKRGLYIVPLLPALAASIGVWLSRVGLPAVRSEHPRSKRTGSESTGSERTGSEPGDSKPGSSEYIGRFDRATLITLACTIAIVCLAIAGLGAWIVAGGTVPQRLDEGIAYLRDRRASSSWIAAACSAAVVGLAAAWFGTRRRSLARACVGLTLATIFVWHIALTPFIDPLKDMGDGTRELVARVPESESLVGLSLDETTRSVIPYYSGRLVENSPSSEHALGKLTSGSSRHLFLMPGAESQVDPALRKRMQLVEHKMLNANRALDLYAFE